MNPQQADLLFQKGIEAFNSGHFFDAHEHWEDLWRETPTADRVFLQGLIQVAAAFHHYSRANLRGTRNLLRAGLGRMEPAPAGYRGLDLEPLREAVRQWLTALDAGTNPDQRQIPRIGLEKRSSGGIV